MTENSRAGNESQKRRNPPQSTRGDGEPNGPVRQGTLIEDPDARSRKMKIIVLVIVLAVLALAAGGYLAVRLAGGDQVESVTDNGPEAPTERLPDADNQVPPREGENPFSANIAPESVSVPEETMEVTAEDNSFVFSRIDLALVVDDEEGTVNETEGAECSLVNDTEICYAGYVEFDEEGLDDLEVFAVKNIAENRILESNSDVGAVSFTGTDHAFVGNVVIDSEEYSVPFMAVSGDNGSGFLMMLSDEEGRSLEDFNDYQPHLSVEQ